MLINISQVEGIFLIKDKENSYRYFTRNIGSFTPLEKGLQTVDEFVHSAVQISVHTSSYP